MAGDSEADTGPLGLELARSSPNLESGAVAPTLVSGIGVAVVGTAASHIVVFRAVGLVVPSEAFGRARLLGGLLRMVVLPGVISVAASPCPGSSLGPFGSCWPCGSIGCRHSHARILRCSRVGPLRLLMLHDGCNGHGTTEWSSMASVRRGHLPRWFGP